MHCSSLPNFIVALTRGKLYLLESHYKPFFRIFDPREGNYLASSLLPSVSMRIFMAITR
jgi:hypothetical protein